MKGRTIKSEYKAVRIGRRNAFSWHADDRWDEHLVLNTSSRFSVAEGVFDCT